MMEKSGLTIGELSRLISFGLPPLPLGRSHSNHTTAYTFTIAVVLLLAFPSQLVAPIITGSITWSPVTEYYNAPNISLIVKRLGPEVTPVLEQPFLLRSTIKSASASGYRSWGGVDQDSGAMRRVLNLDSASDIFTLPTNSTLNNITVPYFEVTSFQWLSDPESMLAPSQLAAIDTNNSAGWTNVSVEFNPSLMLYNVAMLVKPTELFTSASNSRSVAVAFSANTNTKQCSWDRWAFAKVAPTNAGFAYRSLPNGISACYIVANITYTAGSATCNSCRLASSFTVQNDTPLAVVDDKARPKATSLMAEIAYEMTLLDNYAGVPQSQWDTTEQYVVSMLRRSYMAAWTELQSSWGGIGDLTTGVSLPVEFSQGEVDLWRVWLWLALQALVTVSGILYIILQARIDRAPIRDMALVGLFLDARTSDQDHSLHRTMSTDRRTLLKLHREDGKLLSRVQFRYRSDQKPVFGTG
ncbi:hypothetical protein BDV93DRAFT_541366 [Ceratobasidium sp. AG-I]|nr:hypothetical protein BDV93DRAFT_541366 [Ceratobasidium sp. AG-I]